MQITMLASNFSNLVRKYFSAYQSKERAVAESMLSEDFTFTSPYDNHISKSAYFERCWPNSETIRAHHIKSLLAENHEAFVLYECELMSGIRFRNTEYFRFDAGKIREIEVYFGSLPEVTAVDDKTDAAAPVRTLIEDRLEAVRAKDVDRALGGVAPDILMFDVVNPLQSIGADRCRKRTEAWFSSFDGPIGFEMRDLNIAVDGDVALSHSLNRYSGTKTDGGQIDMWVRVTTSYLRIAGKWLITHEHGSVPFDTANGKASLDLKP